MKYQLNFVGSAVEDAPGAALHRIGRDGAGVIMDRYVPGPGTDEIVVCYRGSGTADRRCSMITVTGAKTHRTLVSYNIDIFTAHSRI